MTKRREGLKKLLVRAAENGFLQGQIEGLRISAEMIHGVRKKMMDHISALDTRGEINGFADAFIQFAMTKAKELANGRKQPTTSDENSSQSTDDAGANEGREVPEGDLPGETENTGEPVREPEERPALNEHANDVRGSEPGDSRLLGK